jgi:acyl-CoA reductase-like NAD-dependent aldehyde dehydrogenase
VFDRKEHFIGGNWHTASGGDLLEVISPSTEEIVGRVPVAGPAEIDLAVATARSAFTDGPWTRMSLRNSGQICISTNRVLVQEDDRDTVVGQLADYVSRMKIGDPHDADTDFGPLAAARQRDNAERFIASGWPRGRRSSLAAAARPRSRKAGTSSRRSSSIWTTGWRSPRRRSSGQSCP